MRALITGADGFVGKVLSTHLERQGWDIIGADLAARPEPNGLPCDISRADDVERLVEQAGPLTHVFHLAAVTFVPEAGRNPAQTFAINLQGTIYLLAAIQRHCPNARVIFVGSAECYGPPQFLPVTEEHPLNPNNPYAISKTAADLYCAYLHKASNLDVIRMRPFNHSGPGQADSFVLSSFAHQIAQIEKGKIPPVIHVGNLQAARDFSHVNDVVRAYEAVALKGHPGEAYNVCSGAAVSIGAILDKFLARVSTNIEVVCDPDRLRPVEIPAAYGSHEKLTAHTGWTSRHTLDDILADLLDFWHKTL